MGKFFPPESSDVSALELDHDIQVFTLSQKEKRNILKLVVKAHIRISIRGFRKKRWTVFLWETLIFNKSLKYLQVVPKTMISVAKGGGRWGGEIGKNKYRPPTSCANPNASECSKNNNEFEGLGLFLSKGIF